MRYQTAFWSLMYSVGQIIYGLLLHPYQTMRQIVRERYFAWMVFAPVFLWFFGLVLWRILSWLTLLFIPFPNLWIFLAFWFSIFCLMYQILLLYFFMRFLRARI